MAHFVYDGDLERSESSSAMPVHPKATTSSTSTPATQMDTDGPAETSLLAEKDKDKDKEKKEKEKDTVTIEVRTTISSLVILGRLEALGTFTILLLCRVVSGFFG